MSEYQFIHFMAVDRALDDEQIKFMERQSSRAEISSWEFTNEYNFGDFHGNAEEMLRHGYDLHLHYANFGIRKLMIRLPGGLPRERKIFDAFLPEYGVKWIADKKGKAGILLIEPEADAGSFDELFDLDSILPKIAPIRQMLIEGDLRPLYVAWLACHPDPESTEPPVPAGLQKLTAPLVALADFYEVPEALIASAAKISPPVPASSQSDNMVKDWLAQQPEKFLRKLAEGLLSDNGPAVRAETMSRIRDELGKNAWPQAQSARTFAQLEELSNEIDEERKRKAKIAKETARSKRLKDIAAHPQKTIENAENLVKMRSSDSYRKAAQELVDLREALGPKLGPEQAEAAAEKLRRKYPTLKLLISALKKEGLLQR